ncbi:MAG: DUF5606 domain-containing protein [Bacteroidales bacterium]|nr:DUF5606 domain-containing protein [Bacteroidales bacterium]
MKTDLARTLSVSGQPGLFNYIAQARGGAIVESLVNGKRTIFGLSTRMTSLADISIYTDEGELKLAEVFLALKAVLGEERCPSSKGPASELVAIFEKAVPTYDRDRFYVSHMKKVSDWYNCLLEHASFDFVNPDEEKAEEE